MNFNLYLDDDSAKRLDRMARETGESRNAIIRKAVAAWLDAQGDVWPAAVLEFEGEPSFVPFEAHRAELGPAADDPFGNPSPARLARTRRRPKRRAG